MQDFSIHRRRESIGPPVVVLEASCCSSAGLPSPELGAYLEGHADLVSRLIIRVTRVTIWVIGAITLLAKSP